MGLWTVILIGRVLAARTATASAHAHVATHAKEVLLVQTMHLLRFHSEIYTVIKPNIAAIRKTQNIDFVRHYLSGRDFLMSTESVFWAD